MDDRTQIESAKPLENGYKLNSYTVAGLLGHGGFGITYLAHDEALDRTVAIKEYLPTSFACRYTDHSVKPRTDQNVDDYDWGLRSFLKEAKILAKFNHENIVRVHTVFEKNNTAYMVMAYEDGEDLASILKKQGTLTQSAQQQILFPIIAGMAKIHDLGFIHRDIKPSNIHIRDDGTPVLIDFGSARETAVQNTGEMTALISQGYTPLEQYSPSIGKQGPWTDIYALAATMYQGITGAKPEDSISRSARRIRGQSDDLSLLPVSNHPGYDEPFLYAVERGLALNPDERPQNLSDWQALFTDQPPVADDHTQYRPLQGNAQNPAGLARSDLPTRPAARRDATVAQSPLGRSTNTQVDQAAHKRSRLVPWLAGITLVGGSIAGAAVWLQTTGQLDALLDQSPNTDTQVTAPDAPVNNTGSSEQVATNVGSENTDIAPAADATTGSIDSDTTSTTVSSTTVADSQGTTEATSANINSPGSVETETDSITASVTIEGDSTNSDAQTTRAASSVTVEQTESTTATLQSDSAATESPSTSAENNSTATATAPAVDLLASEQLVFYESPVVQIESAASPVSIAQLIDGKPLYAPIEGLDASAWADQTCSNCHDWQRDNLCAQAEFYISKGPERLDRIAHPYGGEFKRALYLWAKNGCA